jgi:hypothetical protein
MIMLCSPESLGYIPLSGRKYSTLSEESLSLKIEQRQSNEVMHDALQSVNDLSLVGLSLPDSLKEYG